jgi:hypothetical protein
MAFGGHTFWPSFPTLEVALNPISHDLWHFSPNFFWGLGRFFNMNLRLEGNPKYHGHWGPCIFLALLPNIGSDFQ